MTDPPTNTLNSQAQANSPGEWHFPALSLLGLGGLSASCVTPLREDHPKPGLGFFPALLHAPFCLCQSCFVVINHGHECDCAGVRECWLPIFLDATPTPTSCWLPIFLDATPTPHQLSRWGAELSPAVTTAPPRGTKQMSHWAVQVRAKVRCKF